MGGGVGIGAGKGGGTWRATGHPTVAWRKGSVHPEGDVVVFFMLVYTCLR